MTDNNTSSSGTVNNFNQVSIEAVTLAGAIVMLLPQQHQLYI